MSLHSSLSDQARAAVEKLAKDKSVTTEQVVQSLYDLIVFIESIVEPLERIIDDENE